MCKKDYETEEKDRAQQRAVEPGMNEDAVCTCAYCQ
jgi:hypothetical protein